MADNTNRLELVISIKEDGSVVIDQVRKKTDDLGDTTERASAKGVSGLKAMKAGWLELAAGVTAGYFAVKKGFDMFIGLANVAGEAEQIEKRAAFQMESWGYKFQEIKPYVDAFANSVQATTRFSDEMARQALGQMMQYTSSIEEGMRTARLAMDLTTQTGMDLGSTTRYLGLAMNGNTEILVKWFPMLKKVQEKLGENATAAEKWAATQDYLNKMFGDAAQRDLETYGGKVSQLKNSWDDLKKEIGKGLTPTLSNTFDWLTKILKNMEEQRRLQKEIGFSFWSTGPVPGMPYSTVGEIKDDITEIMEARRVAAEQAAKIAAEQAAQAAAMFKRDPDRWKKWVEDFDDVTYAYERLGIKSTAVLSKEATDALRYAEVIKKAFQGKKASVSDYINALNTAADAMKKLTGEDLTNQLVKNEEEYQKRIRAISPEASDEERRKQVQAAIDDWQKARKEIEKMKIPVHADIAPAETEINELIRRAQERGITIPVSTQAAGGGAEGGGGAETPTWLGKPIGMSGALMDLTEIENKLKGISDINIDIGIYGTGSTRKPITEKIHEIIDEFGGLEKALSGMEAEINLAELTSAYQKLNTQLESVNQYSAAVSNVLSAGGNLGSWFSIPPQFWEPMKQQQQEIQDQMRILQMKMDYQTLRAYGGSYQTGTQYVPQTGLYKLHEGEQVISKNQISVAGSTNNFFIKSVNPRETADEIAEVLKYHLHGELSDLLKRR